MPLYRERLPRSPPRSNGKSARRQHIRTDQIPPRDPPIVSSRRDISAGKREHVHHQPHQTSDAYRSKATHVHKRHDDSQASRIRRQEEQRRHLAAEAAQIRYEARTRPPADAATVDSRDWCDQQSHYSNTPFRPDYKPQASIRSTDRSHKTMRERSKSQEHIQTPNNFARGLQWLDHQKAVAPPQALHDRVEKWERKNAKLQSRTRHNPNRSRHSSTAVPSYNDPIEGITSKFDQFEINIDHRSGMQQSSASFHEPRRSTTADRRSSVAAHASNQPSDNNYPSMTRATTGYMQNHQAFVPNQQSMVPDQQGASHAVRGRSQPGYSDAPYFDPQTSGFQQYQNESLY